MVKRVKPGSDVRIAGDKTAGQAIAAARTAFNQALADRDMAVIESVLAEDCVLTPGDDGEQMSGRQTQLDAWRSIMTQAPDLFYLRAPMRIDVSEDGLLAAESGRWNGSWSAHGVQVRYSGRYFAKWRLEGNDWRIASEVFVTLKRT